MGFSDTQYPRHWTPNDVAGAIDVPVPVLYLLVHPRNWQARPMENALDESRRIGEGVRFQFRFGVATSYPAAGTGSRSCRLTRKWPPVPERLDRIAEASPSVLDDAGEGLGQGEQPSSFVLRRPTSASVATCSMLC